MTKRILLLAVTVYAGIATAGWCFYSSQVEHLKEENAWYDYQYIHAYNAMETVAEYCDSTADTGEMDEFISSSHGMDFWEEYTKVNENQ